MTTLEEIAFVRLALKTKYIDSKYLRRAYIHRRAGRTKRSIPRLLLKNQIAERSLLEQLVAQVPNEVGTVNDDLRIPERPEKLLKIMAQDPESNEVAGHRLGLCVLKECVGVGGEACVYRARHLAFGCDVVVKALLPGNRKTAGLQRLRKEAELCSRLQHESIAQVYDFDVAGLIPYVAFEYIHGESLHDRIERFGRLTPEEVVTIGKQAALGLAMAHKEGLLHRDIKPSNIMVTTAGKVKIIDFGFARDLSVPGHITATGFIVGTPYYTAPEYGLEEAIDGRADLYSLGVTLFYALTGTLPFESRSIVRLLAMHLQEEAPVVADRIADAPPKLANIIDRLLKKAPEERFASAKDLAEQLSDPRTLQGGSAILPAAKVVAPAPPSESAMDVHTSAHQSEASLDSLSEVNSEVFISEYDELPEGLLQTFKDVPEKRYIEAPARVFYYPGSPHGDGVGDDDGDADEEAAPTPKLKRRDTLPDSNADLMSPVSLRKPTETSKSPWPKPAKTSRRSTKVTDKSEAKKRSKRRQTDSDKRVYCAACEVRVKKAKKILGNIVCLDCADKVKEHGICTACFGSLKKDKHKDRGIVFRNGRYCSHCTKRVILYCARCRDRFPLLDIAKGQGSEVEGKPYCRKCSVKSGHVPSTSGEARRSQRVRPRSSKLRSASGRYGRRRRRR